MADSDGATSRDSTMRVTCMHVVEVTICTRIPGRLSLESLDWVRDPVCEGYWGERLRRDLKRKPGKGCRRENIVERKVEDGNNVDG